MLAAGIALSIVVIGSVASYLLISRDRQTRAGAISNSDNRAEVMRQVLDRFTGAQSASAAVSLAEQPALADALERSNASLAVRALFALTPNVDLSGETLVITGADGVVVFARSAADLTPGSSELTPPSLSAARIPGTTPECQISLPTGVPFPGVCGIELLAGRQPSYDVAVPVMAGNRRVVGVVAYLAPLGAQLERFKALFQFPTAFISASRPDIEVRSNSRGDASTPTPDALRQAVASGADIVHDTYPAPLSAGGTGDVAGSFVAVRGLDHRTVVGYIGVEAPLSVFAGDTRTDELTLLAITLLFLLVTALAVTIFVNRFVKRPVALLAGGVARIAGGDYGTPIEVRSRDELGRLAVDVNTMRDSIATYLGQITEGRRRLDSAVGRISSVSRALTTTTAGMAALQEEVVRTARAIAGDTSVAILLVREDQRLTSSAADPPEALQSVMGWPIVDEVLAGRTSRKAGGGGAPGSMLAVPMFYQEEVIGALLIVAPHGEPMPGDDEQAVLTVLANNAAVAMENTRLYEQERETVRRLRELDAMKTDFLSTVQHELRTPLTAILGLADLMSMCWDTWADEPKLEAIGDIQVAARSLHQMVETIIDFAMLEDQSMRLDLSPVSVRPAVEAARTGIEERSKGGLPVAVKIEGGRRSVIQADAARFEEVIRALLDNAVKFSGDGGSILVKITGHDDLVRIDVIDRGIGIVESELPRIFDRFYQVDNTATRRSGGTGMGLALVKRLVEAQGARIAVESAPGKGSTFSLFWPAPPAK